MALRQSRPGDGSRSRRTHFAYVETPPKQQWHAWIAGPTHWFQCHDVNRHTKPCLHDITGGELRCPWCLSIGEPADTGYVPLYKQDNGKPVMTVVHAYSREQVDQLKLHQRVLVGRGIAKGDGVYVVLQLNQEPRYQSTLPERLRPADLTETLLRVWGIPDLIAWHCRATGRSDGGCITPLLQTACEPVAPLPPAVGQGGDMSETLMDALKRVKERERKQREEQGG